MCLAGFRQLFYRKRIILLIVIYTTKTYSRYSSPKVEALELTVFFYYEDCASTTLKVRSKSILKRTKKYTNRT